MKTALKYHVATVRVGKLESCIMPSVGRNSGYRNSHPLLLRVQTGVITLGNIQAVLGPNKYMSDLGPSILSGHVSYRHEQGSSCQHRCCGTATVQERLLVRKQKYTGWLDRTECHAALRSHRLDLHGTIWIDLKNSVRWKKEEIGGSQHHFTFVHLMCIHKLKMLT